MKFAFHELTRSIAGKESISECNAYELKQLISHYPYFGPAHLLLAKKLKQEEMTNAEQHLQKAALYFQNPLWFDHLVNTNDTIEQEEVVENPEPIHAAMETPATHEEVVVQTLHHEESELTTDEYDDDESEKAIMETEPLFPPLKIEPMQAGAADTELTFEPYHTVDYFASQGIKAREEEKPKDRFTQQLKSFTEWLKIMRRVPASEVAAEVNPNEEKKVEQMAERSITDREVLTEAMAEVWEKQGNPEKARAVYQKLSLLDPSKSSYFAAKIDQLKNL